MSDAFVEVMNLATDEVQSYGPDVSPERAVRNAWLLEQGRAQDLTDEKLVMAIPVRRTQLTVSCGDWCAMTRTCEEMKNMKDLARVAGRKADA